MGHAAAARWVPGPPEHAAPGGPAAGRPAAHQAPRLQQAGAALPSKLFLRIEFHGDGFADSSHSNIL